MDDEPNPAEVPAVLVELIRQPATWRELCGACDAIYPDNPVAGEVEA
jgi:hypothetical protein